MVKSKDNVTEQLIRKKSEHNELIIGTLEELSLHQEDIEKIDYLHHRCRDLKILLLQNNVIPKIENLYKLKRLEYLNLAINNIEVIENLEDLESLQKLDLTLNFIGQILSVESLRGNYNLKELTLTGNPCTDFEDYRNFVIATLPQLEKLDGTEILRSERICATQCYISNSLRKAAVQFDAQYCIKRDEQKIRVREEYEKDLIEYEGLNDEEINERFWKKNSEHCPETRIQLSNQVRKSKGKDSDDKSVDNKPKQPNLFTKCGRPYCLNQPKIEFRFRDEPDRYELELEIFKFLDTSLIEVDVQINYCRITIKNKIFQMALTHEVKPDISTSQRSMITGFLLIVMPKLNPEQIIQSVKPSEEGKFSLNKNKNQLKTSVDYRNIVKCVSNADDQQKTPDDIPDLI